jgi:hypothetical protein
MKHATILIGAVAAAFIFAGAASAQIITPGAPPFLPPPPAPPPPPSMAVPVVPKMDAPPAANYKSTPGPSFGERITTCLDQGAAAGLGPNERATYSRSCATR